MSYNQLDRDHGESFGQEIQLHINSGIDYLLAQEDGGVFIDFDYIRHGPSDVWPTVCAGFCLAQLDRLPPNTIDFLLDRQSLSGGWGWNSQVPPDSDITLQAMRLLKLVGHADQSVLQRAENFVLLHQNSDGGISPYMEGDMEKFGYSGVGWYESHPCVSAMAVKNITNPEAKQRVEDYLDAFIEKFSPKAYWWNTTKYISSELGIEDQSPVDKTDAFDLALELTRIGKQGEVSTQLIQDLLRLQYETGGFPPNSKLWMPRPHCSVVDIVTGIITNTDSKDIKLTPDNRGILSTSAALIALNQQKSLLGN